MRKSIIIASVLLLLLTSCVSDYSGDIPQSVKPQVVVNSVISPGYPITMSLNWSKTEDGDDYYFNEVRNAVIRIWEDGQLIVDETYEDCSSLTLPAMPKHGSRYELKITVPDYGDVTACTSIPAEPSGNMRFKGIRLYREDNEYYIHANVSDMRLNSPGRALWLVANVEYERNDNIEILTPTYYHPDTYEIDQVNVTINSFNAAYSGTVVECEGFIRIPQDIVERKDWINFSFLVDGWLFPGYPSNITEGGEKELKRSYISQLAIDFIAPSDEYDRYCRSVYKQYYFRYDPDTPFLNENVFIQGNIKNGLGLFAGCAVHRATVIVDRVNHYEP